MKRRTDRRKKCYLLFRAILLDAELILSQIGNVCSLDVGGDNWNSDQVGVNLQCLQLLVVRFLLNALRRDSVG